MASIEELSKFVENYKGFNIFTCKTQTDADDFGRPYYVDQFFAKSDELDIFDDGKEWFYCIEDIREAVTKTQGERFMDRKAKVNV